MYQQKKYTITTDTAYINISSSACAVTGISTYYYQAFSPDEEMQIRINYQDLMQIKQLEIDYKNLKLFLEGLDFIDCLLPSEEELLKKEAEIVHKFITLSGNIYNNTYGQTTTTTGGYIQTC